MEEKDRISVEGEVKAKRFKKTTVEEGKAEE